MTVLWKCFWLTVLIAAQYFWVKNFITKWHHDRISESIHQYRRNVIDNHDYRTGYATFQVGYNDMEAYEKTLFRFWDWSDKHILSKDKFAIIEPYLKKD